MSWIKWTSGVAGALFVLFMSISVKGVHFSLELTSPFRDYLILGLLITFLVILLIFFIIYFFQLQKSSKYLDKINKDNANFKANIEKITKEKNIIQQNRDGLKQSLNEKQNQVLQYENTLQLNSNMYMESIKQRDIVIRSQAETIKILRENPIPEQFNITIAQGEREKDNEKSKSN